MAPSRLCQPAQGSAPVCHGSTLAPAARPPSYGAWPAAPSPVSPVQEDGGGGAEDPVGGEVAASVAAAAAIECGLGGDGGLGGRVHEPSLPGPSILQPANNTRKQTTCRNSFGVAKDRNPLLRCTNVDLAKIWQRNSGVTASYRFAGILRSRMFLLATTNAEPQR